MSSKYQDFSKNNLLPRKSLRKFFSTQISAKIKVAVNGNANNLHERYNPLYFTKVKSGLSARLVCDAVARKYTRKSPHSLRPVPSETQSNFAFRLIRVSFRFHSRIFLRFAFRLIQKITHDLPIKKLANFAFFTKKLSKKSDSFAPKF